MAHRIGDYTADAHSFHHAEVLMTDISVIRTQQEKAHQKDGRSIVIHHHLSTESCTDAKHETWGNVEQATSALAS